MDIELEHRLTEVEMSVTRNEARIDKLEKDNEVLHNLASSVAVLAEKMTNLDAGLSRLTGAVDELKAKPGKRWEGVVEKVIFTVIGGVIGYFLIKVGIG